MDKYETRAVRAPFGYRNFQVRCAFAECDPFKSLKIYTNSHIYSCWYKIDTVLY